MFEQDIARVLISVSDIASKVREMGAALTKDYAGRELVLVGLLNGAAVFLTDLGRQINLPVYYEFMAVSSYGQGAVSSGDVVINKDLSKAVAGRHLLLVEDIVDTGHTVAHVLGLLTQRGPASLKVCAFLDKPSRRQVAVEVDYVGFTVPDEFLVGYGLDYAQKYRNLPYVGVLKPEVYR